MKAIYQAIRALAYPNEQKHQANKAFASGTFKAKVREALREFERKNRGIRHELDAPYLQLHLPFDVYYALSPAQDAARERLYSSARDVVTAFAQVMPGTHPSSDKLQLLLSTQDNSGFLEFYTTKLFEKMMENRESLRLNDKFYAWGKAVPVENKVELHMKISASDLDLYETMDDALRTIVLDLDVRTLAGISQFERTARREVKALFGTVTTWPEFEDYWKRFSYE